MKNLSNLYINKGNAIAKGFGEEIEKGSIDFEAEKRKRYTGHMKDAKSHTKLAIEAKNKGDESSYLYHKDIADKHFAEARKLSGGKVKAHTSHSTLGKLEQVNEFIRHIKKQGYKTKNGWEYKKGSHRVSFFPRNKGKDIEVLHTHGKKLTRKENPENESESTELIRHNFSNVNHAKQQHAKAQKSIFLSQGKL